MVFRCVTVTAIENTRRSNAKIVYNDNFGTDVNDKRLSAELESMLLFWTDNEAGKPPAGFDCIMVGFGSGLAVEVGNSGGVGDGFGFGEGVGIAVGVGKDNEKLGVGVGEVVGESDGFGEVVGIWDRVGESVGVGSGDGMVVGDSVG